MNELRVSSLDASSNERELAHSQMNHRKVKAIHLPAGMENHFRIKYKNFIYKRRKT